MKHGVDGRKFGRNTSHRKAMFRNMANSVILLEQITTSVQKAKEAKRVVDRLITLGKSGTAASRRLAFDRTRDNAVVAKLFGELAQRYKARAGGYTRTLKMAERRWGDAAEMSVLELVDHPVIDRKKKVKAVSSDKAEGAETAAPQAQDPFKKMKKVFAGGKGGKVKGASKGTSKAKGNRKTPAASSSNKSSGSSS